MDAGKRTINEIFNGSRLLEIPFFQRAYVWGETQWERLLEDVETVSRTRTPYFMGSVILKQQLTDTSSTVGDVRTVIDGQQRLTTLSILLKVLCLKNASLRKFDKRFRLDDDRTVLQHNHNDIEAYNAIMELERIQPIDRKDNISRAYQYFLDNLDPSKVDFDTVCHAILFVGIDLAADEDEQQIFDTINSLGVRLTTAELLKNYFFGRNDLTEYNKYWLNVFEKDDETKEYWDREITTGRKKRTFIDLFFFSFLQIKMQDSSLDVRTDDKLAFSKVEKLFDSYKRFIKDYCANNKRSFLDEIREYAAVFRKAINSDTIDKELPASAGIERLNAIIFALDTTTLIPYVLFIERNVQDISVRNDLYNYLESYLMRRLVTRATTKNYNQLFSDRLILNRVLTKQGFISYLGGQDDKINRMPTDNDVKTAFNESWLTNKYATGVLYLIESKIRDRRRHSTQLLGISKYSLEHIMPKKWRNHWFFSGDQAAADLRDRKLLTLGNLTIITQALNASIRDSDWATKKLGQGDKGGLRKYAEGIETFSAYHDLNVWDEAAIQDRASYLSTKALEIWCI
ncbi:DUF262 domain-containing HNH endonuclease family protein [Mesobacillus subterraneus]|uniref:DUF262 domain-containing protein n=1 Tax=Mesobacillus subterraneus TaxID=285983 RepID=UPI002040409F|nr:DUF262 domain-containing protein [Mesobacillus subterraneus]MCM3572490.1 DUF262 domain-containing HNH endonuclease family protein [Mesobacillus subterraneus]